MGLDLSSEVPGQARRRKVPEKFKFAATSATTDHAFPSLLEYYGVKVHYVFVDTMIQELQRCFKGGDNSIWDILHAFHCMVVPENWKTTSIPTAAHQAVKKLCHFYNIEEEDKLLTELKVFHTSYSCPPPVNVSSILSAVKVNNAQLVFPNMTELLKNMWHAFGVHSNCGTFLLKTEAGENQTSQPLQRGEIARASFVGHWEGHSNKLKWCHRHF